MVALVFLYLELGTAVFAGAVVFLIILLVIPLGYYLAEKWEGTLLKAKGRHIVVKFRQLRLCMVAHFVNFC